MSSDCPIFGTAIVSKIGLEDPAGLQHKLQGHYVMISNPVEDLFFVPFVRIILEQNNFPYPSTINSNNDVPDTLVGLLYFGTYVCYINFLFVPSNESVEEDEYDEHVIEVGETVFSTF